MWHQRQIVGTRNGWSFVSSKEPGEKVLEWVPGERDKALPIKPMK